MPLFDWQPFFCGKVAWLSSFVERGINSDEMQGRDDAFERFVEMVACGDKTGEGGYSKGTGCPESMFSFRLFESEASYG